MGTAVAPLLHPRRGTHPLGPEERGEIGLERVDVDGAGTAAPVLFPVPAHIRESDRTGEQGPAVLTKARKEAVKCLTLEAL